jgi:hypothetical protein
MRARDVRYVHCFLEIYKNIVIYPTRFIKASYTT